jgi:Uma2 family endonuclease
MVRLDENPPAFQNDIAEVDVIDVVESEVVDDIDDSIKWPPCNLYSDEPPLETDFHRSQIDLLIRLLHYWWRERQDFYITGNLTVYYNANQLKKRDFVGPDVFVVMGAEKRERRSWATWEEGGRYPNIVIELLSNSTAKVDKGAKKALYQNQWRLPEYYWFHPETLEFAGFRLSGDKYEPIKPTETGLLWSEQLKLHLGIYERQLRWFTAEGTVVPLPEEAEREQAEQARSQAEQERDRADQAQRKLEQERDRADRAQQKLEQLEALIRTQGIDLN